MNETIGRLTRLGFATPSDCLFVVPKGYRDYLEPIQILPIPDTGVAHYLTLTLIEKTLFDRAGFETRSWKKGFRLQVVAVDGRGDSIPITIFGNYWPWLEIKPGTELHLYGEVSTWNDRRQIANPELVPEEHRGRVVPLYKGKSGQVSAETIAEGVAKGLPFIQESACTLLEKVGMRESEFAVATGLADPVTLFRMLHQPETVKEGELAAIAVRHLTIKAIIATAQRNQAHQPVSGSAIPVGRELVEEVFARIPFAPTADQKQAVAEIASDLRSPFPMRRLLSGDVGTGKTVSFAVPAVAAYKTGARVGIIAPNQLLVKQIAEEIRSYYPEVPVCEVVSGSKIGDGVVVGTTAVYSAAKKQKIVFDLVVTDEQHKFSAGQKEGVLAPHTNLLESTATAIPRTLALVAFGGMDLSVLRECPVKKEIKTRVVQRPDGGRLFDFVTQQMLKGGQIAIIYPLAEDKGDGDKRSVEAAFQRFNSMWPGKVGMLHGNMPDEEKNAVISRMKNGELSALISSTVIEVGITLPSLRAVVVVHPERFGTSQLHQLRGRLARKGGTGFFFLYCPENIEETAAQRLQLLVECGDGFILSERDADLRGFGEVDGDSSAQTGESRLLFWGVKLSRKEIEDGAKESSLHW